MYVRSSIFRSTYPYSSISIRTMRTIPYSKMSIISHWVIHFSRRKKISYYRIRSRHHQRRRWMQRLIALDDIYLAKRCCIIKHEYEPSPSRMFSLSRFISTSKRKLYDSFSRHRLIITVLSIRYRRLLSSTHLHLLLMLFVQPTVRHDVASSPIHCVSLIDDYHQHFRLSLRSPNYLKTVISNASSSNVIITVVMLCSCGGSLMPSR